MVGIHRSRLQSIVYWVLLLAPLSAPAGPVYVSQNRSISVFVSASPSTQPSQSTSDGKSARDFGVFSENIEKRVGVLDAMRPVGAFSRAQQTASFSAGSIDLDFAMSLWADTAG